MPFSDRVRREERGNRESGSKVVSAVLRMTQSGGGEKSVRVKGTKEQIEGQASDYRGLGYKAVEVRYR